MNKKWITLAIPFLMSACATMPKQLQGNFVNGTPSFVTDGQKVRWGGTLIRTIPMFHQTCFEILSRPLDTSGRPQEEVQSTGRFTACAPGFYDPEVYQNHRDVTVIGQQQGTMTQRIGQTQIIEPKIDATQIYIWPRRLRPVYVNTPLVWGPYGPYPWGWGEPWYGGYPDDGGVFLIQTVSPPPPSSLKK